jgi:hypothetical protein
MVKIPDPETDNPKTATNWTTITDPLLVEQKILAWNQRHFSQASTTPLATAEIQCLLSFGSTSSIADKLLFQKLDPQHITPDYSGQQLLAKCSSDVSELTSDMTFEDDMKQRYRCWPERTSTSPSGRHLSHGYYFNRWHQVVNAMIEKEPGDPRIHRLRVIHLYEADYSLTLGIQFRQLMHHCEDNQFLNPGCYGC